jgi:nicotinate-nucleotide pyrophosphorylase
LDSLSDEQLIRLEGRSRSAILNRLRTIENIQDQLTGISTQLNQVLQLIPDDDYGTPKDEKGKGRAE